MLKTAEWVSPKHPDKMCDQISDAILDFCLKLDPNARVAIETMGGHGRVVVMGELTMKEKITPTEIEEIVYRVIGKKIEVYVNIVTQSPEIAQGVDTGGAGDQGIMVGYACSDNERMIPQEKYLADSLGEYIYEKYPYDGKTQITTDEDGFIETVVVSFQNIKSKILSNLVYSWSNSLGIIEGFKIYANPAGDWSQGGFDADTGLTGRKLMVDNYGPQIPIGGGAFSGKDATKVDRSGAYMARKIAVHYLKKMSAKEVFVKLAYSIGVAEPVMVSIIVDGKEIKADMEYLIPKFIIETLGLREPIFEETAKFGHFGRGFNWDK